ncbi:MAG: S8 family serine peptidase, partial [Peptostreptococcaceae bacterium]
MCLNREMCTKNSYCIIYQGKIIDKLKENGIKNYIILNTRLAVIYLDEKFNPNKLSDIDNITWYKEASPMSSLIQIDEGVAGGETVLSASGSDFIENNPYITVNGEGVIIAIIDSGIDYLHLDFMKEDKKSKIISIWDQESTNGKPPEGMIFGSEFTREDINKAIENNDGSLTKDTIGTGTIASGIAAGKGNLNKSYEGGAPNAELLVVKLREYEGTYEDGKINYIDTDFLAAIKYVIDIASKEKKLTIINLTVGSMSRSIVLTNLLDTFSELSKTGIVLVSGAGNEGNTNIHYEGFLKKTSEPVDVIIEVGEQNCLDLIICSRGPDRISAELISPAGELSYKVEYSPDNQMYTGKFNLENSFYYMRLLYPDLLTGSE